MITVSPSQTSIFLALLGVMLIGDLIWIRTDPRPRSERLKRWITMTYPRVTLALLPQFASGFFFPWPDWSGNRLIVPAGIILFTAGFGLALWSRFTMGSLWNPPFQHTEGRQVRLVTSGPFAWSRNPIYVGLILIMFGFALAVRSWFFFAAFFLYLAFRRCAMTEEALLEKAFGAEYLAYKDGVPRFL